jgi:import receptor subunit TOM70
MIAMLASTSTNNGRRSIFSTDNPLFTKYKIWLIGIGAGIGVGIGAYYIWKRTNKPEKTILLWAQQRKAHGIDVYKDKQYKEAIDIFNDIIQSLIAKSDKPMNKAFNDLVANCENNIAACYEAMLDYIKCIDHCTRAIQLKPDYAKALIRRARCLQRLERPLDALEDYMALISFDHIPQQYSNIKDDIENLLDEHCENECKRILENRMCLRQKISQSIVESWQFSTSIHDPLLLRAQTLTNKDKTVEGSLDAALIELNRCNYNDIALLSSKVVENDQNDLIERAQAVLLASRFLHYHGLEEEAVAMADKFMTFWEQLDESQKLINKDLHVAKIVLEMNLERSQTDESGININGETPLNENKISHLNQLADQALSINPKNVDPLVFIACILQKSEQLEEALSAILKAKQLDKDHPFIKYYETYINFVIALRNGNTADIHKNIFVMEQTLKDCDKPPVFALLMLAKIGILMHNNEIVIESVQKAIQLMPNCSAAIYLTGLMEDQPRESMTRNNFEQYFQGIEKTMFSAIEADPNYWEPYRMLAKMQINKQNISEAIKYYDQALELAREKDELKALLKEKFFSEVEGRRRDKRLLSSDI